MEGQQIKECINDFRLCAKFAFSFCKVSCSELIKQIKISFLLLIITQVLHSVEEYFGKLWEVFLPARILSSLVSDDVKTGFLILNIGLFTFGLWCWFVLVSKDYTFASWVIWFWIIIEIVNGIGHPLWALYQKAYAPGVATAPLLLILAVYLCKQLLRLPQAPLNEKNESKTSC